ncbi:MAG: iron-containing alcohol dehydrogenase [Oscillospiraceae bacterium]|nr:iron-containing alcohol dehydrogenase [Oscillospiraceae bacterium]
MKLYNPTKVYFENGCVAKYGNEIVGKRILILTGKNSSKANHSLDDVTDGVGADAQIAVFDEVESDPSIAAVVKAAKQYRNFKADVCIGVGGGSAIDAAKAVAVLLANDENADIERLFFEERKARHLPVVAVPTTCGTGSEVTPFSVLTDTEKNTKRTIFSQLYPQLALVDPRYLRTISYKDCVSTCADALSHLIEAFLSSRANDYNRLYSTAGLNLFGEFKDHLSEPGKFEKAGDTVREKMMACAMLGGYAIAANGTSIPHGLANTITHDLKISHGRSVILFIPGYLRNFENREAVDRIVKMLGFGSVDELEDYLHFILGSVSVPEKLWHSEIEKMLSNTHKLSSYPYEMTRDILEKYPGSLFCIQS